MIVWNLTIQLLIILIPNMNLPQMRGCGLVDPRIQKNGVNGLESFIKS